ncbi:hypothetical protein C8A01DRAFT_38554 [Parachaetomium inaequale]|uniref:Uncharacterized protein n=1 Tax=Parachaetomium inaequale TaxID=2588326 RepID=A0AAN6PFC3_9PEZI|nr:hypothetical protein C8A01DRAFT_38554 [Parachaetomium inaequale]
MKLTSSALVNTWRRKNPSAGHAKQGAAALAAARRKSRGSKTSNSSAPLPPPPQQQPQHETLASGACAPPRRPLHQPAEVAAASLLPFAASPYVNLFLFHRHEGIWSVAWVKREDNTVWMDDGISNTSGNISNNNERTSRLRALLTKLNRWAAPVSSGPRYSQAVHRAWGVDQV